MDNYNHDNNDYTKKNRNIGLYIFIFFFAALACFGIFAGIIGMTRSSKQSSNSVNNNNSNSNSIEVVDSDAGYGSSFSCTLSEFLESYNSYVDKTFPTKKDSESEEDYNQRKSSVKIPEGAFEEDEDLLTAYNAANDYKVSVALDDDGKVYIVRFMSSQDGQKFLDEMYSYTYAYICKCLVATLNPDMSDKEANDLYIRCIKESSVVENNKTYTCLTDDNKGYVFTIIAGEK